MGIQIEAINTIAELEHAGIEFQFAGGSEVKLCCPFHEDKTPSCHLNVEKRLFKCQTAGCEQTGDIVSLLARYLKTSRAVMLIDLEQRYSLEPDEKRIDPAVVERWHQQLWNAGPLLSELYKRGVTDEMIRKYRFGEDSGRITIPITNASGAFVNVRKYLPGAPGKDKMRNTKGHSKARFYPVNQLQYPTIVLTGGECKAIVAADQLNQYSIGCITATAGEGNLAVELAAQLKGKSLYVCMDIDDAGQAAAKKHCQHLSMICPFVANIVLPLDRDKYPKGDINDFVAQENGLLKAAVDFAIEYKADYADRLAPDTSEPIELELNVAIHADNARSRLKVKGVVSAMDTTPYLVPKDVAIKCGKDQSVCAICPVFLQDQSQFTIPPESPSLLELIGVTSFQQLEIVKATIGIPRLCKVCEFEAVSQYNIEDTRVSPQLEITNRFGDRQPVPAFCIGTGLNLNESYELTGRLLAHPKTQQATLLVSTYRASQDALSTYTVSNAESMGLFWPSEWTVDSIQAKLDHIYSDFEANVTRIYQRQSMHLVADLTYHSVLAFRFDGKYEKGWLNSLILGDSSHGKTEVTMRLQQHYQLGHKLECANSSVAGVLGGMEKMGERWFVSWGVIPTHDRRLVILEEVKEAPLDIISKLRDMRSSGRAEIAKIGKNWKTHARTRQIWLSNPRAGKMAGYTFGITAIKELIGALEDVRRFDIALLVADAEIDASQINKLQADRPHVPITYTDELCRQLVLWAWTRTEDEVIFSQEATSLILEEASKLCAEFTDTIPLIDRGGMRYKIARLAAALAARLFCCSEDFSELLIFECHVQYVCNLLRQIYGSPVFGYSEFSAANKLINTLVDKDELQKAIQGLPFPRDFLNSLLSKDFIELQDICDWSSLERDTAQVLLSLMVRKHAMLRSTKSAYRKSPQGIDFFKSLSLSGDFVDRPKHIEERF